MSFLQVWSWFLNLGDEEIHKLLDGVSVGREFEWAVLNSISLLNEVTVEHVLWNVGVLSTEELELLGESSLDVISKG